MLRLRIIIVLCLIATLQACGQSATEPVQQFEQRWIEAVEGDAPEQLYAMLDSASRYRLEHDLNVIRGLDPSLRQSVLRQLGASDSGENLQVERYFALLWRQVMNQRQPDIVIADTGSDTGLLTLTLTGRTQRFELAVESGRWVWRLPEPSFAATPRATEMSVNDVFR